MHKGGKLHLGEDYIERTHRLRELLGARKDTDAVRQIIDAVLDDAEEMGITNIPRRAVGIKAIQAKRKKATSAN